MIVLSGADLVLPAGVQREGTLVIEGERITDIRASAEDRGAQSLRGHLVVAGFIDVHVHGSGGVDTLDGDDAVATLARKLPKYGVTAFCPTTVACSAGTLTRMLGCVAKLRQAPGGGARVLAAHLESNFINPEFKGAQPEEWLRQPSEGADVLAAIDEHLADVAIVTVAPELEGGLDFIRRLASKGCLVSLGHSGATLEQSRAAIAAGARQATHLFNRMPPLHHREPGLAGAVLTSEQIAAEIICDGVHVHPQMVHMAIAAKGAARVMAITDAVAAAGLAEGAAASLGGRPICVRGNAAFLADGTLAGSVATMNRVFRVLVREVGLTLPEASRVCSATPAAELKLRDAGTLTAGALADLVVLDGNFNVTRTYVGGQLVYESS